MSLGIISKNHIEYYVKVSMFRFKMSSKLEAVQFCNKYYLDLDKIKEFRYSEVYIPKIGDKFVDSEGKLRYVAHDGSWGYIQDGFYMKEITKEERDELMKE